MGAPRLDRPAVNESQRIRGVMLSFSICSFLSSVWMVVLIALAEAEKEAPWLVFLLPLWCVAEVTPGSHQ